MRSLISGTGTSGHGDSLHFAVIDEAWAHQDDHVEAAVRPTLMTTAGQLLVVSAAGTEKSSYFRAKIDVARARAESGVAGRACYVGYSFADDEDPADPETWRGRVPPLGVPMTRGTATPGPGVTACSAVRPSDGGERP